MDSFPPLTMMNSQMICQTPELSCQPPKKLYWRQYQTTQDPASICNSPRRSPKKWGRKKLTSICKKKQSGIIHDTTKTCQRHQSQENSESVCLSPTLPWAQRESLLTQQFQGGFSQIQPLAVTSLLGICKNFISLWKHPKPEQQFWLEFSQKFNWSVGHP